MAKKEIVVVINGEEYVSAAADKADDALGSFTSKIPGWGKAVALLSAAYLGVREALVVVKEWVLNSIDAFDAYAVSQSKLSAQAKMTGIPMKELREIVARGKEEFGLSTIAASEMTVSVAKFAAQAGVSARASELMAASLDLGAASGMTASEVAEGLSSALAGNDEWLNRLGLANPSQLWKDYAIANGMAVSQMSETEKKLAVLNAITGAAAHVHGTLAQRMEGGAGAQQKLNNELEDAQVEFGRVIQPARILVLEVLTGLVTWLGKVALAMGVVADRAIVVLVGSFRVAESVTGKLAQALGWLTGNAKMVEWGERHAKALDEFNAKTLKARNAALMLGKESEDSSAKQVTAAERAAAALATAAARAEAESKRVERVLNTSLGAPLKTVIGMTEGAIRSLAEAAQDQLPPDAAAKFNAHMVSLAENAKKVGDRITTVPKPVEESAKHAEKMAREVEQIGRSAIDAAASFGVIDDRAARSLNSAVNIAASLGKMMASGFSFGGVVGVIGGVASIVSTMMQGDKERRDLTRDNNAQLRKLNTDGLKISNKATGQQIAGITNALSSSQIADLAKMTTGPLRDVGNQMLVKLLADQGLRLSDLDAVASELGMKIRRDNGQIELSQLPLLFQALQQNGGQLTRIGQSFGEQFAWLKEMQRLEGSSGVGAIQGLLDFLTGGSGQVRALQGLDLSNTAAARNQLLTMLGGLNNNVFNPADFGRLTGEEFRSVIVELIGLLDGLKDQAPSPGTPPPTTTTDDVVESTTGVAVSVASVQDVIEAMDQNIIDVLSEHTALQDRIALATEGAWNELQVHTTLLTELVMLTESATPRLNSRLAEVRAVALANAGRGPEF